MGIDGNNHRVLIMLYSIYKHYPNRTNAAESKQSNTPITILHSLPHITQLPPPSTYIKEPSLPIPWHCQHSSPPGPKRDGMLNVTNHVYESTNANLWV